MEIDKFIKSNGDKKYAYVMLLMIDEKYVSASLVLAESMRKTACLADLVVMIDETISEETINLLKKFYDRIIEIKKIKISNPDRTQKYLITKIEALKLTEYEKVALIDVDSIILDESNKIFEEKTPGIIYSDNTFNTGLVLLEPNKKDYDNIKSISVSNNIKKTFLYVLEKYYTDINKLDSKFLKSNNYTDALGIQYNENKPFIIKSPISIDLRVSWPHFKLWFLYLKNILNDYPDIEKYSCMKDSIELSKYYLASLSRFLLQEREKNKKKLKKRVKDLYNIDTEKDLDYYHLDISKEYDSDELTYLINDYTIKSFVEYLKTKTNLLQDSVYTTVIDIKSLVKMVDDINIIDWILSEYVKIFNNIFVILMINEEGEPRQKITNEMKNNLVFRKEFKISGIILKSIMFNIYQENVYNERIQELSIYNDYTEYRVQLLLYQSVYPLNIEGDNQKIFIFNDTNEKVRLGSVFFNTNTLSRYTKGKMDLVKDNKISRKGIINILKFQTIKKWLYNTYSGNELDNVIVIKSKPFTLLDTNKYNEIEIKKILEKKIKLINIIFSSSKIFKQKTKSYDEVIKNINNPKKYWQYEGIKMYIYKN